ncbi:MAG: membrane protein insertion efficiency factor YidD [Halobacteriovoraceae bacterium]|nr:membrane protein insertion efficiency factor YidD [Halobacteriovoraceae bacterium]MBT5096131.1 membrane protein insertion efficiency factor YidD [Halobacteriovoraceae bacterium]
MLKILIQFLIRLYQVLISPWLGPRCRFEPSCSHYAHQSFQHYPSPKALWYSIVRISKCHPFHPGGHDPLPLKKPVQEN